MGRDSVFCLLEQLRQVKIAVAKAFRSLLPRVLGRHGHERQGVSHELEADSVTRSHYAAAHQWGYADSATAVGALRSVKLPRS